MIIVNCCLVILIAVQSKDIIFPDSFNGLVDHFDLAKLRIALVLAILLNTIELFSRIRIFDFFAYFVR